MKKVVITGASRGLGLEISKIYASQGNEVYGLDLALPSEEDKKIFTRSFEVDVTSAAKIQKIADQIGNADIVIANAGLGGLNPAFNFSTEIDDRLFDVNYKGTRNIFLAFTDKMKRQGSGKLVAIGSMASYRGLPMATSYCASKAAQRTLCECFRMDLSGHGVIVQGVFPGFIKTAMGSHGRFEMPFTLSAKKAAEKTFKAIEGNYLMSRFPLIMGLAGFLNQITPARLYSWVITTFSQVEGKAPEVFGAAKKTNPND